MVPPDGDESALPRIVYSFSSHSPTPFEETFPVCYVSAVCPAMNVTLPQLSTSDLTLTNYLLFRDRGVTDGSPTIRLSTLVTMGGTCCRGTTPSVRCAYAPM